MMNLVTVRASALSDFLDCPARLERWNKRRLQRWTRFTEPRKGQFIDTTRPFSDTYMRSLDQRSRR